MPNPNKPEQNKDVKDPKSNEGENLDTPDIQESESFDANLKLADDSDSSTSDSSSSALETTGNGSDTSASDVASGDKTEPLTPEQLEEINSKDPETQALRDFLKRVKESMPRGLEADLKPNGGKLRTTTQIEQGQGRVFEHVSSHEDYGEIKQTQFVSGENQGKVLTEFENHPQIQSVEFDTNNPGAPPIIKYREGQEGAQAELPSVISGEDAAGQPWKVRADGSLERHLNGEPQKVIQYTPFDGAGRIDTKEFSDRLESRFQDRFEIDYKNPQTEDGLIKLTQHNDGNIVRSFADRDDGLVEEDIKTDEKGRTKTRRFEDREDGQLTEKSFIGVDSSSLTKTYSGRADGLTQELSTAQDGETIVERSFTGRKDNLVSEVVNPDGSVRRGYSDGGGAVATRFEELTSDEVARQKDAIALENSPNKTQIEALSSDNPEERQSAVDELIKNVDNWSASDARLISQAMSPELMKAFGQIDADSLGENKDTVVESLSKYVDPDAPSVTQEKHELATRALANLAGSEKLSELGFKVTENNDEFKAVSKNGTEFEFTNREDGSVRFDSIRNRPDGGVLVNHFDENGEVKQTYEQVFDGENRTDYMRNADGNVTEIRRPDGSKVNIDYEDGVATRIQDSNGYEFTSSDGKNWKMAFQEGTINGELKVGDDGKVSIVGNEAELTLGSDASITTVDKVNGITTKTEQNGVSVSLNQNGDVVGTTDRLGRSATYRHDADGNLKEFSDSTGDWKLGDNGVWTNRETGDSDNQERFVDEKGRLHIRAADKSQEVHQLDGSKLKLDSQDRVTDIHSANGQRTRFEYEGDDTKPSSVRYGNYDYKWVSTNDNKTEWKRVDRKGDRWVDNGKTWSGTIESSEQGHRETSAKTGKTVERNSDGSRFERNKDNDITEMRTASGDTYEFRYSRPGQLSGVTRPDGTTAGSGGYHGWSSSDGKDIGGASIDQETGRYRESGANWTAMTLDSDGTKINYEDIRDVSSIDLGQGRAVEFSRDSDGNFESSVDTRVEGIEVSAQADGSRVVEAEDGLTQKYDENGHLMGVERPDGSTVTVERDSNGEILSLSDSKSTIRFEKNEDGSFEQVGSQPPDRIENAKAFVNPDGTFGLRNEDREILRTDSGFVIKSKSGQTELQDKGSVLVRNAAGEVVSATSARGESWEVSRTTLEDGTRQANQIRIGDKVWNREGNESSWTSNDGQTFSGEIDVNEDGSLSFVDAESKFETVRNLDGSTLFRDAEQRVRRIVSPEGRATTFGYSAKGDLLQISRDDGTTLTRIADRKTDSGRSIERWMEKGTTDVLEGHRSVDENGNITFTDKAGNRAIEQPDGWTKNVPKSGDVTFTKEASNGSSVTKNEQGQIVRAEHADGDVWEFGYDDLGRRNSINVVGGSSYESSDGGKTWTSQRADGTKTFNFEALVTEDGSLVWKGKNRAGEVHETVYKSDGSRLTAQGGRITSVKPHSGNTTEIGYGDDNKPNYFKDSSENGAYWRTEDGETWNKYNAQGELDSSAEPQSFKLDIGPDGTIRKNHFDGEPPYTELERTDGSTLSYDAQGRKLNETKFESFEDGKPQYSEVEYKYDSNQNLESFTKTMPDGTTSEYDNLGRVTKIASGDLRNSSGRRRRSEVRQFEYSGDSRVPSAYIRDGKRFELDQAAFGEGRHIYKTAKDSRGNQDMIVGRISTHEDGTVEVSRGDGSSVFERIDGSTLSQAADGTSLDHRYDGFLTQRLRSDGVRESYEYELSPSRHVLGRRNQVSSVKKEYPSGAVATWQTRDGFNWTRAENGKEWQGFTHINHETGAKVDRYTSGNTYETGLNGKRDVIRSFNIEERTKKIKETFDYWYDSNALKDIRSQLRELDAEETYMVRHEYNPRNLTAIEDGIKEAVGGGSSSNHRWTEAEGYLRRTESLGFNGQDGVSGENYAIQLEVDSKEIDRWWWNRDRSKSEILTSTRRILGSASEAERVRIDSAHSRMYGENLSTFYGEDGGGHQIASWDSYHEKLLSVASEYGVDKRTPEMQAEIMNSALEGYYGNRDEYFSEAASLGFATDEGRQHFVDNGGLSRIRSAFTQTHYNQDGSSYTTTNEAAVTEMTDFAERGELRPITEFRKAFGVFSNDQTAMENALSRLSPEERATLADGKRLFDDGTIPTTTGQQEALDYYKSWHKAFRDAHWFSEEAKATGYEDQALHEGGTDINDSVAPIGTHWTNSHEINATAVEDMSQESFNLLMQGIDLESDRPTSSYYEQMRHALSENLGDGDYIRRANKLLDDKMAHAKDVIEATDSGNLDDLRNLVPAFSDIPQEDWDKLSGGYQLETQIQDGTLSLEQLNGDQVEQLEAYRGDNDLRTFMEGREVASHLHDIDSGAALESYKQGSALHDKIQAGELSEDDLTDEQMEDLATFNEYSEALSDNDLTLLSSVVLEQRAQFFKSQGDPGRQALGKYQQLLYESTKENARRDVLVALQDNDHTFSDDQSAMLDAVANMKPDERERYRKNEDNYREDLDRELLKYLGGENGTAYKAARVLLDQISADDNIENPSKPKETIGYQLLKQKVDGELGNRSAANLVRDALAEDPELAQKLLNDDSFKEQAIAALGSERQYERLVEPLLTDGRLPVSTLIDLNTRIESDGEGNTYEVFEAGEFFKDTVLDASSAQLNYLASDEGKEYRDQIMEKLSPGAREIFESVLKNERSAASINLEGADAETPPRVDPEDRIRAYVVGAGVTKEEVRDLLSSLSETDRIMAIQDYALKYDSQLRGDLFDKVKSGERDEFEYLTRGSEWSTEQSHLHNIGMVASTDSGIGGELARNWNMMHQMSLANFEFEKWQSEGHIEPEKLRELNEAVQSSVDAFIETKDATADTVVTGIITAGAIGASFFTGGTSLMALYATGGVILGGGVIGAGTKYALMGNDHEGLRAIAGDFVKYSALTAANVIDPAHLGLVGQLGRKTAISATENALANVAIKGVTSEVREQVSKGMMQLVRDGISYGGGVADDAIVKMVGKINGLDDVAKAQLSRALQTSLRESVENTARTGLKQVLHNAQVQAKSMGLITMAGAGGNVVGDMGLMLVEDGEIDASRLTTSAVMGGTFGFGFGGLFKLGGAGFSRILSRNTPDAPNVHLGDGGSPDVHIAQANVPEGSADVQIVQAGVQEPSVNLRPGQAEPSPTGAGTNTQTAGVHVVQTDFSPPGHTQIDVTPQDVPPGLTDVQVVQAGIPETRVDLPGGQTDLPQGRVPDEVAPQGEGADIIPFESPRQSTADVIPESQRPPVREAARLPSTEDISDGVYRPKIEVPGASEVDAIAADVPALNKPVAEEFSKRLSEVQDRFTDDLTSNITRARELAPQVDNARLELDAEISRLRQDGHSIDDINAAMRREGHPLNQDSDLYSRQKKWKELATEHSNHTRRVDEVAQSRRDLLQNEINDFVRNHNLENPDSPLPEIRIEVAQNMHASGGYAFGEGVLVMPKSALVSAGGGGDLSRVAFHELVHAQQDMDIVRNLMRTQTSDGGTYDAAAVKDLYRKATGQDLTDAWLDTVRTSTKNSPDLNEAQIVRAQQLADEVKSANPVAEQSQELGNTARVIDSKLEDLRGANSNAHLNELIRDLSDPNGGEQLARRLFGEEGIPENLESAISAWKAKPKNSQGLAQEFSPGDTLSRELIDNLESRLDSVNGAHRRLIDDYAGSRLEREAYGLDSNISGANQSSRVSNTSSTQPQTSTSTGTRPKPSTQDITDGKNLLARAVSSEGDSLNPSVAGAQERLDMYTKLVEDGTISNAELKRLLELPDSYDGDTYVRDMIETDILSGKLSGDDIRALIKVEPDALSSIYEGIPDAVRQNVILPQLGNGNLTAGDISRLIDNPKDLNNLTNLLNRHGNDLSPEAVKQLVNANPKTRDMLSEALEPSQSGRALTTSEVDNLLSLPKTRSGEIDGLREFANSLRSDTMSSEQLSRIVALPDADRTSIRLLASSLDSDGVSSVLTKLGTGELSSAELSTLSRMKLRGGINEEQISQLLAESPTTRSAVIDYYGQEIARSSSGRFSDKFDDVYKRVKELDEFSSAGLIQRSDIQSLATSQSPTDSVYLQILRDQAKLNPVDRLEPDALSHLRQLGRNGSISSIGMQNLRRGIKNGSIDSSLVNSIVDQTDDVVKLYNKFIEDPQGSTADLFELQNSRLAAEERIEPDVLDSLLSHYREGSIDGSTLDNYRKAVLDGAITTDDISKLVYPASDPDLLQRIVARGNELGKRQTSQQDVLNVLLGKDGLDDARLVASNLASPAERIFPDMYPPGGRYDFTPTDVPPGESAVMSDVREFATHIANEDYQKALDLVVQGSHSSTEIKPNWVQQRISLAELNNPAELKNILDDIMKGSATEVGTSRVDIIRKDLRLTDPIITLDDGRSFSLINPRTISDNGVSRAPTPAEQALIKQVQNSDAGKAIRGKIAMLVFEEKLIHSNQTGRYISSLTERFRESPEFQKLRQRYGNDIDRLDEAMREIDVAAAMHEAGFSSDATQHLFQDQHLAGEREYFYDWLGDRGVREISTPQGSTRVDSDIDVLPRSGQSSSPVSRAADGELSPVRYSQEEVNSLYAVSREWNNLRDGLDSSALGDSVNNDVRKLLEANLEDPGLSQANREAARSLLDNYRADNPAGVKRVHDYLEGKHDSPWRADSTPQVKETLGPDQSDPNALTEVSNATKLEIYEPEIPVPSDAVVRQLEARIPQMNREAADELVDLMESWRASVADDLRPESARVDNLHERVLENEVAYNSLVENLKSQGVSADDIKMASRTRNHPLNEEHSLYQHKRNLEHSREVHMRANFKLNEKLADRVKSLEETIDRFAESRGLPVVEITSRKATGSGAEYATGEGLIRLTDSLLLEPGGSKSVSRIVFHELVHLEQDTLLVRNAIQQAGLHGKPLDADGLARVKELYTEATGFNAREVNDEFLEDVAEFYKNADRLTPEQIARADRLAGEAKSYDFDVDRATELGNTSRVLKTTAQGLMRKNPDGVNKLFNRLDGPESNINIQRLFGDEGIPADIQAKFDEWKQLPKDENGLTIGFDEGEIREAIVDHIVKRVVDVKIENKAIIDKYAANGLEQEAYGLDHLVSTAETAKYGADYHTRTKDQSVSTRKPLSERKENLARSLDDVHRPAHVAVEGAPTDLGRYSLKFGDNSEPILLNGEVISLGRRSEMDISFSQGEVSGKHAEIYLDGNNSPRIRNLSQTNHTFVNGELVDGSSAIKPGDLVNMGFYRGNEFYGAEFVFGDKPLHQLTPVEKGLGQYQLVSGDTVLHFDSNKVSLGRAGEAADLQFSAPTVSARHAEIEFTADGPLLRDTGSRNGTFVNGEKITERVLKPGDKVQLSDRVEFVFGQKPSGKLEEFKFVFDKSNQEFDLPNGVEKITIGRSDDADFRVTATVAGDSVDHVSRMHAEIRYEEGKILIEDLGSRNGTYVNGVEIKEPTMLVAGDRVRFGREGSAELTFDNTVAFKADPDAKHPITGTNFNRGDRVRIDDVRYLEAEAIVGGRDPDTGKLIVVVGDRMHARIEMKDASHMAEMKPVNVNGRTLYKDEYNGFYEAGRWHDRDVLMLRPDVQLIDESIVKEAFAPIDFRVGMHIENSNLEGQRGEVLAYTPVDGDPVVRLQTRKRFKKGYEENTRLDTETGDLYIGDERLSPIDVEGQKLYHDSNGNVYGADYAADGSNAFVYKNHDLKVWERTSSARAQLQPSFNEFSPPRIEMPRSFDELPNVDAPRSHSENVLYANTEFYLNDKPMTVNGEQVSFDGGEIAVGRELLGLKYEGTGAIVSAEHGKFGWDQERQLFYFDDHSTNGTYVRRANSDDFKKYNGTKERPRRVYLAPGDELRLGAIDGEKLNLSVPDGWTNKRLGDVDSEFLTQVYFDGRPLEMDGYRVNVGRNFQDYGNNSPTDALNRRVARLHAELSYDRTTDQWQIADMSGGPGGTDGGNVHQTIMVGDSGSGNGIYIKRGGSGEVSFHADEVVSLGANDRVHLGSPNGPELKLVTRRGKAVGDGRVSFQKDNLDWVINRPDGSHTVTSFNGSKRMVSPDGTIAEATMANGRRLRFKYEKKQLSEIRLPDNSSVVRADDGAWVRRTTDGVEEPWWRGPIEVEPDGSLRYNTIDTPPQSVIQRLDNTIETIDAKGRVTYGDVDLKFEKESLVKYGDTLAHPERKQRFIEMMDSFEARAKTHGHSDVEIAQSYHQIRRLLEADDGAFLTMTERQKLAEQTLFQMANPDKVSQGANNTCNVTTIEKRILHKHPEEYARLVADVATTGKYVTADGTLVDMSRVPGALEPDYEARMLNRPYDWAGEDLHRDGRRTWASQIFETTAVGIKYARGGSVNGEFIGSNEIVMYQKSIGPSGQEGEQLVKYGVDFDGKLTDKVLEQSPSISGSELTDINNQIIGKAERDFVIGGSYFPDAHDNNRFWFENNFPEGSMKIADSPDKLREQLVKMQQDNNLPAVVVVHTGHKFFGSAGGGNNGGAHVMNIKGITQDSAGNWMVEFTNQWGDAYNKTIPLETMYQLMNAP